MKMNENATRGLPRTFCWTRFGAEAGEQMEAILARKELERRATGGVFLWGIGNAVGPGIAALVDEEPRPEVLFSPIKSRPRPVDIAPDSVVQWSTAETLAGERFDLPAGACVTSRGSRSAHYALVCASPLPLRPAELARLHFGGLRNLRTNNPLGHSQVTAVVRRGKGKAGAEYVVALRAQLIAPYFVRLRDPVPKPATV
jgi:hypothetical protein